MKPNCDTYHFYVLITPKLRLKIRIIGNCFCARSKKNEQTKNLSIEIEYC